MSRPSRWFFLLALPLVAALGACTEDLQTGGTCPVLCPGQGIVIRDTVLEGTVVLDTNLVGFPFQGSEDPMVLAAWTDTLDIRVVARFDSLTRQFQQINDPAPSDVRQLDSAYVTLLLSASQLPTPGQWFIDAYDVFDAFVDDRPENCRDSAVDSKAKVILVWHGNMKDVPAGARRLGIRPVATITEALALLEQLDDIRQQPASLMQSIKRVIGRGTPEI